MSNLKIYKDIYNHIFSKSSCCVLLSGPPNSGKKFCLLSIAKSFLCKESNGHYCDNCNICISIDNLTSPNVILIDNDNPINEVNILHEQYKLNLFNIKLFNILVSHINIIYNYISFSNSIEPNINITFNKKYDYNKFYECVLDIRASIANNINNQPNDSYLKLIDLINDIIKYLNDITCNIVYNTSISKVRFLKTIYLNKNSYNNKQFIIITNIDSLSKESLNALLKQIEEPKDNTFILLTTNNINNVMDTIKSRSIIFNTMQYTLNDIKSILVNYFNIRDYTFISKNSYNSIWDIFNSLNNLLKKIVSDFDTVIGNMSVKREMSNLLDIVNILKKNKSLFLKFVLYIRAISIQTIRYKIFKNLKWDLNFFSNELFLCILKLNNREIFYIINLCDYHYNDLNILNMNYNLLVYSYIMSLINLFS